MNLFSSRHLFHCAFLCLVFLLSSYSISTFAQDDRSRGLKIVGSDIRNSGAAGDVQLWGVVIGVSQYKNGDQSTKDGKIPNLKNAADDAQSMYDFLRSPNGGGFKDVNDGGHLVLLKNEDATKANIEKALNALKQSKPNDYFVLYIAAHGALVPQAGAGEVPYFVLYDSELSNMANTSIRMDSFRKLIGEIPAKKGMVLADTCHSAGVQLTGRGLFTTTRANATWLDELNKVPSGVGYLSAADQTELSYENDSLNAGVFTYSVLEGLRGLADKDNDNIVTFKELKNYVSDKVSELTEGKQRPQGSASDVAANYIPIAVVNTVDSSNAGTGDYGTLVIRTPDLDNVNVSVDGKAVATLSSRIQSTVKVRAGDRSLSFTKDGVTRNIQARVEPGKSKLVEVNLSFSESDEQSLIDSANNQVNVFLREDKEPTKEAKKLFLDGVDIFNKQRFPEAIDLLNKAVQANNGAYADAWVYLGRAHQANGDEAAAVKSFRTALNLRSTDFETKTLLAEARFNIGDNIQEIISDLRDVIKRHPNFDFARVVLGDVFFYRGDVISAELQLRAAIRANPNSPPAHMILADILSEQDSLEKRKEAPKEAQKAIELFNKVSEKQVSVAKGLKYLSLSHILFGGARYENKKAMAEANYILGKALTNLVEYAINNAESLPESGTYLEQGRKALTDAMTLAQKAKDNKRVVVVLSTSSLNNLMREDVNQAIKDGEDALKLGKGIFAPKDLCNVNFTLANAYSSAQKYPKAAENLKAYLDSCGAELAAHRRDALREELIKLQKDPNRKK